MRREFGIALPERAIGIAAHDFAQALGAPSVALTRAARREGVPTVPSRWLLRLDAVLRAVGLDGALGPEPEIAAAAALRDRADARRPAPPPGAAPAAGRPAAPAVGDADRDLDPRPLRDLCPAHPEPEGARRARRGSRTRRARQSRCTRRCANSSGAIRASCRCSRRTELLAIGRECFGPILSRPGVWAFWWPRFERIARWFVAEERARRAEIVDELAECKGSVQLAGPRRPVHDHRHRRPHRPAAQRRTGR